MWRFDEQRCGGGPLVFDHGYHIFSLAYHLMGPVERVYAWIDRTRVVPTKYVDAPAVIIGGLLMRRITWPRRPSDRTSRGRSTPASPCLLAGLIVLATILVAPTLAGVPAPRQGQPLTLDYPRLGMWWPDPWTQSLDDIARYDWVILGDWAAEFIAVWVQQEEAPWHSYVWHDAVPLTTAWQPVELTGVAAGSDAAAGFYFGLGETTGTVWLDDVCLQIGSRQVWRRDYQGGVALVNATASTQTVPLGGAVRKPAMG